MSPLNILSEETVKSWNLELLKFDSCFMGKIQGTNGEDFLGENDAIAET